MLNYLVAIMFAWITVPINKIHLYVFGAMKNLENSLQ